MQFYNCPYCIIISNRKFNLRRHIIRKHAGEVIPDNLFSYTKNGLYSCPYCFTTSSRKYNLKEHINRKHSREWIHDNMNHDNQSFTNSALPRKPSTFLPYWPNYSNYVKSPQSPTLGTNSRKENRNNSLFKLSVEYSVYKNFIDKQKSLQFSHFYQDDNVFNFNPLNIYYEPLSNLDFGNPLLFKIYKCTRCFRDLPFMFSVFDSIRISSKYTCPSNCDLLPRINEAYKNMIDPKIKEFSINKIFSIIDKKRDTKSKLCLKSIKIPRDFYQQINFDQSQFNNKEIDNEKNNRVNIPFWLQKLLLHEEFVDLENTDENNWVNRLMSNNDNKVEIKREELIRFINSSNSTFGLFKFQKDYSAIHYFFTYLQLDKNSEI